MLDPHGEMFWRAWDVLTRTRVINQHGPQPIILSEVLAYATLTGIDDPDDRSDLLHHIERMDSVYLQHEYARRAREARKRARSRRGR